MNHHARVCATSKQRPHVTKLSQRMCSIRYTKKKQEKTQANQTIATHIKKKCFSAWYDNEASRTRVRDVRTTPARENIPPFATGYTPRRKRSTKNAFGGVSDQTWHNRDKNERCDVISTRWDLRPNVAQSWQTRATPRHFTNGQQSIQIVSRKEISRRNDNATSKAFLSWDVCPRFEEGIFKDT